MKTYTFLLFDLDNTLLDFNADMLRAFEKLYHHWGFDKKLPYSQEMLSRYESHNKRWWQRYEGGLCSITELFVSRFRDYMEEMGFTGDPEKINADYLHFLGEGGVPIPGALDMLKKLSKTHEIYIVTNGSSTAAETKMKNSGVLPYVKGSFMSEYIGVAKPDPKFFEYVSTHIPGFEKDRAIVIGDNLLTDIQGGVNSGIDTLWYHPAKEWDSSRPPIYTYEARNFDEILRLFSHE